jgi:hypothetical protein
VALLLDVWSAAGSVVSALPPPHAESVATEARREDRRVRRYDGVRFIQLTSKKRRKTTQPRRAKGRGRRDEDADLTDSVGVFFASRLWR